MNEEWTRSQACSGPSCGDQVPSLVLLLLAQFYHVMHCYSSLSICSSVHLSVTFLSSVLNVFSQFLEQQLPWPVLHCVIMGTFNLSQTLNIAVSKCCQPSVTSQVAADTEYQLHYIN